MTSQLHKKFLLNKMPNIVLPLHSQQNHENPKQQVVHKMFLAHSIVISSLAFFTHKPYEETGNISHIAKRKQKREFLTFGSLTVELSKSIEYTCLLLHRTRKMNYFLKPSLANCHYSRIQKLNTSMAF
ncbi:hypothetical protein Droror1_Dr00017505 [Drosera rotundifolia]